MPQPSMTKVQATFATAVVTVAVAGFGLWLRQRALQQQRERQQQLQNSKTRTLQKRRKLKARKAPVKPVGAAQPALPTIAEDAFSSSSDLGEKTKSSSPTSVAVDSPVDECPPIAEIDTSGKDQRQYQRVLSPGTITIAHGSVTGTCAKLSDKLLEELKKVIPTGDEDVTSRNIQLGAMDDWDWWDELLNDDGEEQGESANESTKAKSKKSKKKEPLSPPPVLLLIIPTHHAGSWPKTATCLESALQDLKNDWRISKYPLKKNRLQVAVMGMGCSDYDDSTMGQPAREAYAQFRQLGATMIGRKVRVGDDATGNQNRVVQAWIHHDILPVLLAQDDDEGNDSKTDDYMQEKEPQVMDMEDMGSSMGGNKEIGAENNDEDDDAVEGGAVGTSKNSEPREMVTSTQAAALKKEGYKLIGTHSAVKLCRWTKHQLRGRGGCYKHTFYGITSYQCMEATPSLACANKCVFCIAEGTSVNLAQGISLPIEQVRPASEVLALDASGVGLTAQKVTAFTPTEEQECVELLFADGRTLVCTPDHRIRVPEGNWVEADKLEIGQRVSVGVSYPTSSVCENANDDKWRVALPSLNITLSYDTREARFRSLAFARLAGYIWSNGTVSSSTFEAQILLRHKLDVTSCIIDVALLTSDPCTITLFESSTRVELPPSLGHALRDTECIVDERMITASSLPYFVLDPQCPVDVLREFLGGLFGGGGIFGTFSHGESIKGALMENHHSYSSNVGLMTVRRGSAILKQKSKLDSELLPLLQRCGMTDLTEISASIHLLSDRKSEQAERHACSDTTLSRVVKSESSIVCDKSYATVVRLGTDTTLSFADSVGFRYCCHKQIRLSAGAAYCRAKTKIGEQIARLRTEILESEAGSVDVQTLEQTVALAKLKLSKKEILHPLVANWWPGERSNSAIGVSVAANETANVLDISLDPAHDDFAHGDEPEVDNFTEQWAHGIDADASELPLFHISLVGKRTAGIRKVFDLTVPVSADGLEMEVDGSFTANGVVVHNCWRHHKNPVGKEWKWKTDDPHYIVDEAVKAHINMIKETKGIPGVNMSRWKEAHTVRHCALSLVGEPIMYPRIDEFLEDLHSRNISTFLVTNGQHPKAIGSLRPITQLYVSVDAPTPESLVAIDRPLFSDAWERLRESLVLLKDKGQRTVARLTVVKGWNSDEVGGYAELIALGKVSLIEIKGVTYCGKSDASNLNMSNTPWHHEVIELAKALKGELDKLRLERGSDDPLPEYGLACEHKHSVSVLLARVDQFTDRASDGSLRWKTWIDYPKFQELAARNAEDPSFTFCVSDYTLPTPEWALFGSEEEGFDPTDTRHRRKGRIPMYTQYDDDGIPTHDHDNKPLSKDERQRLRDLMDERTERIGSGSTITEGKGGEKFITDASLMFRGLTVVR